MNISESRTDSATALIGGIAAQVELRSGSFIVTLYGDVVEPRGRPLWIGNIVEACGAVGISETLVRTSVSRLVASGRLVGDRQGRRSFYRLTDAAREEFMTAARVIFGPFERPGWRLLWIDPSTHPDGALGLERRGYIKLGSDFYFGPSWDDGLQEMHVAFACGTMSAPEQLRRFVGLHWDLAQFEAAYEEFLRVFSPLEVAMGSRVPLDDSSCLHLRLLLVHSYRAAALLDAHLPAMALPSDWKGNRARRLFATLYLALSPAADRYIASNFVSENGRFPGQSRLVAQRLRGLSRSAEPGV